MVLLTWELKSYFEDFSTLSISVDLVKISFYHYIWNINFVMELQKVAWKIVGLTSHNTYHFQKYSKVAQNLLQVTYMGTFSANYSLSPFLLAHPDFSLDDKYPKPGISA